MLCFEMFSLNNSLYTSLNQPACEYTRFCIKIQNLAYTRIEKLSLLNYGGKSRHFDVHLPST